MLEVFNSIKLSRDCTQPLYEQLSGKLKTMIIEGTLVAHYRLPSIRQLSSVLGVNQVTVVSAYRALENDKLIYSRPGSGSYVSSVQLQASGTHNNDEKLALDELYSQDDLALITGGQVKIDEQTVNFASATPTADLFPVENFKKVLNDVLERDKGNAFEYQESQGFYPLRESICNILGKGVTAAPDSIQVISGAQQGIDIISKAFLSHGDYVVTESPTYTGAIAVFKSRGAQIADVGMEQDGPSMSILEYNLQKYKPKLIYTIPSFQNPTGYSYSQQKRAELIRLAEKYNAYIIEDDYVSDLDFDNCGYLSLKALDRHERVIFIKSFSKIFMPGLRLGFMIVPAGIRSDILEAKHSTDISTSGLIQRAFDLYIRKGFWNEHFDYMYGIYSERYNRIVDALCRYLPPEVNWQKPGGGLNIWLCLPWGFPTGSLFKQAVSSNVVFAPGKIFYTSSNPQSLYNARLSYAAVSTQQIDSGIHTLGSLAAAMLKKQDAYKKVPIF